MSPPARARSSSPVLRLARFVAYGLCTAAVIYKNAPAISDSARAVVSRGAYLPTLPCVPCAFGLAAILLAYLTWLAGGTFGGWSMPLWAHLAPILALTALLVSGPLRPQRAPADVDLSRAPDLTIHAALVESSHALERGGIRCDDAGALEKVLEDRSRILLPGYRRFGRLSTYRVRAVRDASGPNEEISSGDVPPTVVVSCAREPAQFWLTAVAMNIETGAPELLRDGVGRVVVVNGTVGPGR